MYVNIRTIMLLTFSTLVFACQPRPEAKKAVPVATVAPADEVTCAGIGSVKLSASYADLEQEIGAKALSEHSNSERGNYTSAWADQPAQLNIFWKEKTPPYLHIAAIETVYPEASYQTKSGLRGGMTMEDVQAINSGMPLTFINPLAVNDPGSIRSFNNGRLIVDNPCLSGYVEVGETRNVEQQVLDDFRTKHPVVDGSHPLIQSGRIKVIFSRFRLVAK